MSRRSGDLIVVTLAESDAERWREIPQVRAVVSLERAVSTGRRFGSLAMGLGIDAALVSIKAALSTRRGSFLATNPWIGVGLKILSRRPVIVTGIYSAPGSHSWDILRRVLRDSLAITLADVEAENWRRSGGVAVAVRYGNDFRYPGRKEPSGSGRLRIFVGGSSDRDLELIGRVEQEVLTSDVPVSLVIAVGGDASHTVGVAGEVIQYAVLPQNEFGELIKDSDIVFLPLREGNRAAGHMLMVGALQLGVPVVFTESSGMAGYADGSFVKEISRDGELLPQIRAAAAVAPGPERVHDFWRSSFSRAAYLHRVIDAIERAPRGVHG